MVRTARGDVLVPFTQAFCDVDLRGADASWCTPPEGLLERERRVAGVRPGEAGAVTFDVVTIFPRMVEAGLAEGVVGRARTSGTVGHRVHDLRDFTTDRHHVVDDVPFGGGPGMVMKAEPFYRRGRGDARRGGAAPGRGGADVAGRAAVRPGGGAAAGRRRAASSGCAGATKASTSGCGDAVGAEEWSIGDYVLSGGELPALVDDRRGGPAGAGRGRATTQSVAEDSFSAGRLGLSALHAAGGVARTGGAGRVAVGASRRDRAVAARGGGGANARAAAGPRWRERRDGRKGAVRDDEMQWS